MTDIELTELINKILIDKLTETVTKQVEIHAMLKKLEQDSIESLVHEKMIKTLKSIEYYLYNMEELESMVKESPQS